MFEFGVDLGADENDHGRYPDPGHEADGCSKRAVGLIVASEVSGVPREQQRSDDPGHRGEDAAG